MFKALKLPSKIIMNLDHSLYQNVLMIHYAVLCLTIFLLVSVIILSVYDNDHMGLLQTSGK